jgi:KaiC/GvpD/RAD55 family RecA-like ATPase
MTHFALLFNSSFDDGSKVCELSSVPEELKKSPEGLFRAPFFLESDNHEAFKKFVGGASDKHFGPLTLVFSVRRARDLLTEGCEYQGLGIEIETGGRKLPQLPGMSELQKILSSDDCLIHVDGNPYKPSTEVFGFQQVYDDSVKCIDTLKKMGIPAETMAIYATPEEICIEIHPGVLGLEGNADTGSFYYRLLCQVAEIRELDGKPAKTSVKTIVLSSCNPEYQILIPGSAHPILHRTKVSVGPSHFAYGVAAFSDFCAKKRTVQECVQESLNWIKFVQTQLPPVAGLKEKIEALPEIPRPGAKVGVGATGKTVSKAFSGRFQPLLEELAGAGECFKELPPALKSVSAGLDKCLGGGWTKNCVHLIAGPVGSGKASFLMQQAIISRQNTTVLYVSFEHGLREFALRSALSGGNVNLNDLLGMIALPDANGVEARKVMAAGIEKFRSSLPENFFFSGAENCRAELDVDEVLELARMLPEGSDRLVILESLTLEMLGDNACDKLQALRQIAAAEKITFLVSMHYQTECGKRPHFIEGDDQMLLERFQKFTDSLLVCLTERLNLRRFVAMVKGQIDAQLVGKLEQKALQLSGGKRIKSDTYSLIRVIHNRYGRRELFLYLFQPDFVRMLEVASLPLTRA